MARKYRAADRAPHVVTSTAVCRDGRAPRTAPLPRWIGRRSARPPKVATCISRASGQQHSLPEAALRGAPCPLSPGSDPNHRFLGCACANVSARASNACARMAQPGKSNMEPPGGAGRRRRLRPPPARPTPPASRLLLVRRGEGPEHPQRPAPEEHPQPPAPAGVPGPGGRREDEEEEEEEEEARPEATPPMKMISLATRAGAMLLFTYLWAGMRFPARSRGIAS